MVACILCLELQCNAKPHDYIELFSEHGLCLKICDIISKHFWLRPTKAMCPCICNACWVSVREFHQFYQRIAEAHNYLELKETIAVVIEDDPLPLEVALKSEEINSTAQQSGNCFDSEIKVEVQDLELLPQAEVIEDTVNVSTRLQRAFRRNQVVNDESTAIKRIKKERSPTVDALTDEPEFELPLAELMQIELKTDEDADIGIDPTQTKANVKTATCMRETQKRRRGRPRKVKVEAPAVATGNVILPESTQSTNKKNEKVKSAKADCASATGTEDSDSSSSSGDSDSDFCAPETNERYAEIPKRVVVKPKKYRKREKPVVAPRRMTREEIDQKNAKQAEYDKVIAKFFNKFQCPKCKLLVKNFAEMRQHLRASHNDEHGYMTCCDRKFRLRKSLVDHIYVHWNPEHFKCNLCGKLLQDSRNLDIHMQSHTNPKQMFQCDKCPKILSTKASFEDHMSAKHIPKSEYKFQCTECTKMFPSQRILKDHIRHTHIPGTAVICDKCGKRMASQSCLKKHHELEHSDGPRPIPVPMQCEICGTWLRHAAGLRLHMRTIHEETGIDHRCHICNKTSTTSRALKRHIYHNHQCERKFKCTMCDKAFKRGQDLREHTSTHTGEVLYTCPNCPMTFFSNANMYKHRQRLHRAEWEADRKKPVPPNIMRQATGASAAMKMQHTVGAASAFFTDKQAAIQTPAESAFTNTTN